MSEALHVSGTRPHAWPVILLVLALTVPAGATRAADGEEGAGPQASRTPSAGRQFDPPEPPELTEGWYTRIVTSHGKILARLLPDQAPQSVAHFAALAEGRLPWVDAVSGETRQGRYYDGLEVHLAKTAERFEVGDPTGTGRGAPLMYVPREGLGPVDFHRPWRLGMTRSGLGRISGVVFFVSAASLPWLSGRHPCFGEVLYGRDVIWRICSVRTNSSDKPLEPVKVHRVEIFKVGDPPPLPEPETYRPRTQKFQLKPAGD